jgi:hypothetical protein
MMGMNILAEARRTIEETMKQMNWNEEKVQVICARPLTAAEAIGSPERQDYPILKGKEFMIEADFRGYKGQAFTDHPGNYSGSLQEILALPLKNNFERALLIATINAVLRSLGKIEKTVHCRDKEPGECARQLVEYVQQRFGNPRIAFVGFQPGMITSLSKNFILRVVDLDVENIGKNIEGTVIEDASHTQEIIDWSDIILATGSTAVNDTIGNFIGDKPTVFYGISGAGIAYLNGFDRYCHCGH